MTKENTYVYIYIQQFWPFEIMDLKRVSQKHGHLW